MSAFRNFAWCQQFVGRGQHNPWWLPPAGSASLSAPRSPSASSLLAVRDSGFQSSFGGLWTSLKAAGVRKGVLRHLTYFARRIRQSAAEWTIAWFVRKARTLFASGTLWLIPGICRSLKAISLFSWAAAWITPLVFGPSPAESGALPVPAPRSPSDGSSSHWASSSSDLRARETVEALADRTLVLLGL